MTDVRLLLRNLSGGDRTPQALAFADRAGAFSRLAVHGALLELVTFGFYRFWLNTDVRRHLWAHTTVGGDALEYTGRARELLIGFLMALAILAPVYFAYFLLGVEAERAKTFGSTPLVLVFFLFGQFAVYRARRYRLTRTSWRGVRFWMTGAGLDYMWRAALWSLLVWLTLGFAYPWRAAALERYKMSRTFYGDLQGDFGAKADDLFKKVWWIWLVIAALAIAAPVAIGYGAGSLIAVAKAWPAAQPLSQHGGAIGRLALQGGAGALIPLLTVLLLVALYARFKTIEWRWWASGLRLGPIGVASKLQQPQYFALLVKYGLALTPFALAAAGLIAYGLGHDASLQKLLTSEKQPGLAPTSSALPILVAGYVLFLLALNVLNRIFLQHHFWRLIVSTLAITGGAAADHVAQRDEAAGALGEGLADGLDVAGF
ncbi:hypothetical protein CCR94_09490 [Rhodoblastus sphagnicola]|uniref:DUF898 domain-containing protein n=1 Tax=Rhodoblastus sphagnicola TaxID=333368 RepID=A0A2S6N9T0_9HYPH|nr:DUF898 family protein [Rhodoblastus sphagnicola]MBB4198198.1 uncharacterized membrane protein YjgN (DUF898 family) [Rhodoblastus sphagnicola]PPQ31370.1 hypothetical protein CCR94_09490 [Rhodoblastus sphagnicola]